LHLGGTAFQAVDGEAAGLATGEMWENQLGGTGHFPPMNQKVVRLLKLGFPTSNPSLVVIPLDHGLESHGTKKCGITHGHLVLNRRITAARAFIFLMFFFKIFAEMWVRI
jgi:hypothetical protein